MSTVIQKEKEILKEDKAKLRTVMVYEFRERLREKVSMFRAGMTDERRENRRK